MMDKYAKILATVGPASQSPEMLEKLALAGANIFRLNCSHATKEELETRVSNIRKLSLKLGRRIGILADLQGPKIRVGKFETEEGVHLPTGSTFTLDTNVDTLGNKERVSLPHPEIFQAMKVGSTLLLDDGKMKIVVKSFDDNHAVCDVVVGGTLKSRKGVNVPDIILPTSPLTPKDRVDLGYALDLDVDWIALSFVQLPSDVVELRQLIQKSGKDCKIISKIEKPSAVEHIEAIIEETDAIMIARGDLGVEVPAEEVPVIQRRILGLCRKKSKPCVVATQMLESMITSPVATRAEASDVATAINSGADAVMLSAESAAGDFPVEAVTTMAKIIKSVESSELHIKKLERKFHDRFLNVDEGPSSDVAKSAVQLSRGRGADAIIAFSISGMTALRVARQRIQKKIFCATISEKTANQLSIAWGIEAIVIKEVSSFEDGIKEASARLLELNKIEHGHRVCATGSMHMSTTGETNTLHIFEI